MKNNVTRRNFLIGSAIGAATLASLASCAPSAPATDTAEGKASSSRLIDVNESDVSRTEECDIVVCGSGSAGTYAAIRAAELGAKVIWLEKTSLKGGTSTVTEGILAIDTKQLLEMGITTDKQAQFESYMQWHNWGAYAPGIWNFLDNSGAAIDWAIEHGAPLWAAGGEDNPDAGIHSNFDEEGNWINNGKGMLPALWAFGESLENLDFRLETPAVNIIIENDAVTGVYAKDAEGIFRINAKAVILATGGFGKNPEMCAERLRVPSERIVFLGFDGQDGDGINMALKAGAVSQAPTAVMYGLATVKSMSWSSMLTMMVTWPASYRYPLEIGATLPMVNQTGKRFYNETLSEDADTSRQNVAIASQPKVFTIFDETHVENYEGEDRLEEYVAWMGVGSGEFRSSIEQCEYAYKADTIEELAGLMGVPADNLVATIDDYNSRAQGDGTRDPFGADPAMMTPIVKAPFYAVQTEACAYSTCGGVRGDYESRAVDINDDPIPGLFVCGLDNGSMQYNDYPYGLHGGSGQGAACTTGFVAANNACKDLGLA